MVHRAMPSSVSIPPLSSVCLWQLKFGNISIAEKLYPILILIGDKLPSKTRKMQFLILFPSLLVSRLLETSKIFFHLIASILLESSTRDLYGTTDVCGCVATRIRIQRARHRSVERKERNMYVVERKMYDFPVIVSRLQVSLTVLSVRGKQTRGNQTIRNKLNTTMTFKLWLKITIINIFPCCFSL